MRALDDGIGVSPVRIDEVYLDPDTYCKIQEAKTTTLQVGGVNHCRSHCRLGKFRGLMCRGKYSAVIGLKEPIA
jgi:hypothetical protein